MLKSLMSYSYGATDKLWSIVGGSIIEVTASGAVGAAAITGLAILGLNISSWGLPVGTFSWL